MWMRCTISKTLNSLLAATRRLQTEQWHSMTPGLDLSSRRTNGFSDKSGMGDYLPWFKCERSAKSGRWACYSRVPSMTMLQTFLITSIKRELKTLIIQDLIGTTNESENFQGYVIE
jgi:hypothetical protein